MQPQLELLDKETMVKMRLEQTLLKNEEVSSQSHDMDEGGLASMPGLCNKL